MSFKKSWSESNIPGRFPQQWLSSSNSYCLGQQQHFNLEQPQPVPNVQPRYYHTTTNNAARSRQKLSEIFKVFSKRCWQPVGYQKKKPVKNWCELVFMSYNVLAQDLLENHQYLYKNHNWEALGWECRWKNLVREIKTRRPDIMCLQEVQESHLSSHYGHFESLGYKSVFKKRTGIRSDGCAIFYKQDKFVLIEYETVEFYQPNVEILNRDNIAIVAKFCPVNSPDSQFIVATTHLLFNPKRQDVRLAQTQLLLTEVERMSFHLDSTGKKKYWPIIICGDFNSTPDSAVYALITTGCLKYSHLAKKLLHRPESPTHGNVLMPCHLEITDSCQHYSLVEKRRTNELVSRQEEAALIKLHNSDKSVVKISTALVKDPQQFSSGTLSHLFCLKSVYRHGDKSNPEGTTYQNEWITVDYIFYSKEREGSSKLKLVALYKLPRRNELGSLRIPNFMVGSDHLCLAAKFQLKI